MARSKLPEDTVVRLLQCQRWGVCDEGTADMCDVAIKTVHRFQRGAAHRAETHHRQSVQHVEVAGVQWDEAHSKLRPKQVDWVPTALAMGSWFLLWVDFGPRTQDTAATLSAQVVARAQQQPLFLTDGWKAYTVALLQVVGVVYRRRRRGQGGVSRNPGSSPPSTCSTPRWSRSATRLAMSWRSAGAWSSVVRVALASSGAAGRSARRSRRLSWNDGMGRCGG
jgi:hypothetical protein